ncbi:MAG: DapH/DapD/GlmU-related protein [Halioglobus sp.]
MIASIKAYLFSNERAKFLANGLYVYLIHVLHLLLGVMPGFVRNFVFRSLLHKAGTPIYFDYGVYIKFPWLVEIGDNVSINRGVEFYSDFFGGNSIVIGSDVIIAPNARFHAADHDLSGSSFSHSGKTIRVGDNVWIGASAIILPGVSIGDGAVVGAGSVVTRDVPENTVAVGNPARVIKTRDYRPATELH